MKRPFIAGVSVSHYDRRHQPVIDLMNNSLFCAFASFKDLTEFVALLEQKVQDCNMISGAPQYSISVPFNEDSAMGSIVLQRKSRQAYVGHLLVTRVKAILEYDGYALDFFDIAERLEGEKPELYFFRKEEDL